MKDQEKIKKSQELEEKEELKKRLTKVNHNWIKTMTERERKILFKYTSFLSDETELCERRWYFLNDQTEIKRCMVCGEKAKFDLSIYKPTKFCSKDCRDMWWKVQIPFKTLQNTMEKIGKIQSLEKQLIENHDEVRKTLKEKCADEKWYRKMSMEELYLLFRFTNFLPEDTVLNERRYYLINDINEIQKCVVCGKKAKFCRRSGIDYFCSRKCRMSLKGKKYLKSDRQRKLKIKEEKVDNIEIEITEENKEEIRERLKERIIFLHNHWINSLDVEEIKQLKELTDFLPNDVSMNERKYCLFNNISNLPLCPVCGEKRKFQKFTYGYFDFCSDRCMKSEIGKGIWHKKLINGIKEKRKPIAKSDFDEIPINLDADNIEVVKTKLKEKIVSLGQHWLSISKEEMALLIKFTDFLPEDATFPERRYYFIHNLTEIQKCLICGKRARFISNKHKLSTFCSDECWRSDDGRRISALKAFESWNKIFKNIHKLSSSYETEIYNWLFSLGIENIERNKRNWGRIPYYEADLFLSDYNLVIEFNGLYWHSNIKKTKEYHYKKWRFFNEIGINCIQIFENEWNMEKDKIKNDIKNMLTINKIIVEKENYEVRYINDNDYTKILESNKIIKTDTANIRVGIFHNDKLIKCLSFLKIENGWTIISEYSDCNYFIENGLNIIINHFKKKYSGKIMCKLDLKCCNEKEYEQSGFVFKEYISPDHFFFNNNFNVYTEKELLKYIKNYDEKLSIKENAAINKYMWIYNCGYNVWVLE